MGPQPSSRGNLGLDGDEEAEEEQLQWGRNLPVAEMKVKSPTPTSEGMLQWGRNLPVAEMSNLSRSRCSPLSLQWGRNLPVAEISMGPQPSSRGNQGGRRRRYEGDQDFNGAATFQSRKSCAGKMTCAPSCRFQWGRNLPVAEIATALAASSATASFQWGRNLPVAEMGAAGSRHCGCLRDFNGAATFQSRKLR